MEKNTAILAVIVAIVVIGAAVGIAMMGNNSDDSSKPKITYDGNGGRTVDGKSIVVLDGPLIQTGFLFTNTNGEFDHWNDKSDGTGTKYQEGGTLKESKTLYAIWHRTVEYSVEEDIGITSATLQDGTTTHTLQIGSLPLKILVYCDTITITITHNGTWNKIDSIDGRGYYESSTNVITVLAAYDNNTKSPLSAAISENGNTITMTIAMSSQKQIRFVTQTFDQNVSAIDGNGGTNNTFGPFTGYINGDYFESNTFTKKGFTIDYFVDVRTGTQYNIGDTYSSQITVFKTVWKTA